MDVNTIRRIRHIFLSPRPHFPLNTVAELLEMSVDELKAEIKDGAIVAVSTAVGVRVTREEMVAAACARSSVSERDAAVSGAAGGDVDRHCPLARAGRHGLGACRGVGGGGAVGGCSAAVCGRVTRRSARFRI
jgi:hypothetical protein